MANIELELLSNIVEQGDFAAVRHRGFTPDILQTEEARVVFQWLWDEFHDQGHPGEIPNPERLMRKFPDFYFCPSRNSVDALVVDIVQSKVRAEMQKITSEVQDYLDQGEDPTMVLSYFLPKLRDLNAVGAGDDGILISQSAALLRQEYTTRQNAGGVTGIPYPWEPLNRATGGMNPEEFIVVYGRVKNGKCIAEGQRIMTPSGTYMPIEQLPENCMVPSFTTETGKVRWASAIRTSTGPKPCVEVLAENGSKLRTSTTHPYLTPHGYVTASNLKIGDYVALARKLPQTDGDELPTELGYLLGTLVGDGNYTRNEVQLTNENHSIVRKVDEILEQMGGAMSRRRRGSYGVRGADGENFVLSLLREQGIHGQKSPEKRTPPSVFSAAEATQWAYLAGLFDTDGNVATKTGEVTWATTSPYLAQDILHLLRRRGILARVTSRPSTSGKIAHRVTTYDQEAYSILAASMSPHLAHAGKVLGLLQLANSPTERPHKNFDGIPWTESLKELIYLEKGTKPWPRPGKSKFSLSQLVSRFTQRVSRLQLRRLAEAWDSKVLDTLLNDELTWERIESITDVGEMECFDISITDGLDPDFVCEDFVVHNSWLATLLAAHAYNHNKRVLVYSREMSREVMLRRTASITCGVDYELLRQGNLPPEEERVFFDILTGLVDLEEETRSGTRRRALMFVGDKGKKVASTVDSLTAIAEKFEPDLVLVDGFYLMRDSRTNVRSTDWKQITHISQDLKGMAQYLKIPLVGTTQANRAAKDTPGDDLSELSYADAIGQDADIGIRCFLGRGPNAQTAMALTFPGVREGKLNPFLINFNPGVDFALQQPSVDMAAFLSDKKRLDKEAEFEKKGAGEVGEGGAKKRKPVTAAKNPFRQ